METKIRDCIYEDGFVRITHLSKVSGTKFKSWIQHLDFPKDFTCGTSNDKSFSQIILGRVLLPTGISRYYLECISNKSGENPMFFMSNTFFKIVVDVFKDTTNSCIETKDGTRITEN